MCKDLCDDEEFIQDIVDHNPGVTREFDWPMAGDGAVVDSLHFHLDRHRAVYTTHNPPTTKEMTILLDTAEVEFSCLQFCMMRRPPSLKEFEKLVQNVEMTTSPGNPWKDIYPTNAEAFGWNGMYCSSTQLLEQHEAFLARWRALEFKPEMYPINPFIKPEAHKITKMQNKAYRIIHGVSITDNLISAWMYQHFSCKVVQNFDKNPIKVGFNPFKGGYRQLYQEFPDGAIESDKSSWDMTMQARLADYVSFSAMAQRSVDQLMKLAECTAEERRRSAVFDLRAEQEELHQLHLATCMKRHSSQCLRATYCPFLLAT